MNPKTSANLLPEATEMVIPTALVNNAWRIINQDGAITADQHRDLQNIFAQIGWDSMSIDEVKELT